MEEEESRPEQSIREWKYQIKVTYKIPEKINTLMDDLIKMKMQHIGAEWYAQGVETDTGIRDLCFDLKL